MPGRVLTDVPAALRRTRRPAALVGVAGIAVIALSACTKPLPEVTFQSGTRSVLVAPGKYCFDTGDASSCRVSTTALASLKATGGDQINISVPRTVALNAWIATAYQIGSDGKTTPLDVSGSGSPVISDDHHGRVTVPSATGSYYLGVTEVRGDVQTGTWTVRIDITN